MSVYLNLPDLTESDPGKPIKASWGDRVVEAIALNCDTILGFGKANSVFSRFNGDGSFGDVDASVPIPPIAVPPEGLQIDDLTVGAGVTLSFTRGVGNNGVIKIGVAGTLTMGAGSIIDIAGQGQIGGLGGVAPNGSEGANGSNGSGSGLFGLGQGGAGGGGGGSRFNVNSPGVVISGGNGGRGGYSIGGEEFGAGGRGDFFFDPFLGPTINTDDDDGSPGGFGDPTSSARIGTDVDILHAGPGGGGGGSGGDWPGAGVFAGDGGPGGDGGPAVVFEVSTLNILSALASIVADANPGTDGGDATATQYGSGGGGGGGTGGSILLCYRTQQALTFFPTGSMNGGIGGVGGDGPFASNRAASDGGLGRPGWLVIRQV